jgi:hypothetical protein
VDDNFAGNYITLTADNNCLGGWDNLITSVRVRANGVTGKNGIYSLQNRNSNKYMDVAGGNTADGANILQWGATGATNQQFTFTDVGDGAYKIINVASGKGVDVAGGDTYNLADVLQWTYGGANNQKFILMATDNNYYKLKAAHSGRIVEVTGAGVNNGDDIIQYYDGNQANGQWKLNAPGTLQAASISSKKAISVDSVNNDTKVISVFPNPAKNEVTVSNVPANIMVVLFDLNGQERIRTKSSAAGGGVKFNISGLSSGAYFIRLGNNKEKTFKLLKQ